MVTPEQNVRNGRSVVTSGFRALGKPREIQLSGWLDLLLDSRGIRKIYGDQYPTLSPIVVHEVNLHRDGPQLTLRFDLPTYPSEPPPKWVASGFNVAQIALSFVDVTSVLVNGMARTGKAILTVTKDGKEIKGELMSGAMVLKVRSRFLSVGRVTAYRCDDIDV
jgi:hypothetical protein